jgi:hypothetical protein
MWVQPNDPPPLTPRAPRARSTAFNRMPRVHQQRSSCSGELRGACAEGARVYGGGRRVGGRTGRSGRRGSLEGEKVQPVACAQSLRVRRRVPQGVSGSDGVVREASPNRPDPNSNPDANPHLAGESGRVSPPHGREEMGSPTLRTHQDPILLLPWLCFEVDQPWP